jgi:translation initiation factor IF-3
MRPFIPRTKENVNEGIRVSPVRVIFPNGANEIFATNIAIQKAKALNLDLILVSPNAQPPVCKIIDEGKWSFEEKKKQHEAKKNQHVTQTKELKFRPGTDTHDYEFKKNHAIEFLKDRNKVRAIVAFKGREVIHGDLGIKLLQRLIEDLSKYGQPEGTPTQEGRNAFVMIVPK